MTKPKTTKPTIVFDFDGTLFFLPVDWDQLKQELIQLLKLKQKKIYLSQILADLHLSRQTTLKKQVENLIKRYELAHLDQAQPLKPVINLYRRFLKHNFPVTILSNNYTDTINQALILFHLPQPHLIISRDQVVHSKPSLEGINQIINHFQVPADSLVIIGDSQEDKLIAQKLGCQFFQPEDHQKIINQFFKGH